MITVILESCLRLFKVIDLRKKKVFGCRNNVLCPSGNSEIKQIVSYLRILG